MDRFDVIKFEDLTGPRGGEWIKIGGGSFGVVFRGEYLGTEVAIKEVLPNNTYDVEKYFERECVLMKEARHPNIVQYIGLTKRPGPNGRIYIISEFVGGNLRSYIADKRKPFDWPLRVSFATDIARAVAYLHARNCLHRDLKGENLLITQNERIKVCDFGFARIAARNEEEMRRISYCGTDGYMSPEILMGVDFSLPSDIFSLGVIFCEIISRHLVDANTFKRQMPSFGLEEDEVREMASSGCPLDFIQLSLDCCKIEPVDRPDMRQVIKRLRLIEQEVIQRETKKGTMRNVGSLRGMHEIFNEKGARQKAPRLPSFEAHMSMTSKSHSIPEETRQRSRSEDSNSDEEMEDALQALENVTLGLGVDEKSASKLALDTIKVAGTFKVSGHGNPWWDEDSEDSIIDIPQSWLKARPVPPTPDVSGDDYSTAVIRSSKINQSGGILATTVSAMEADVMIGSNFTVRNGRIPLGDANLNRQWQGHTQSKEQSEAATLKDSNIIIHARENSTGEVTQSFMTAHSSHIHHCEGDEGHKHDPSLAMATLASSIYEQALLYHRFTLVKSGTKRSNNSISQTMTEQQNAFSNAWGGSLIPAQLILANALTKCNVCNKRLGFGSYMDCDDCPYKTHVGCAAMAEPNCQELQLPNSGVNSPSMGTPLSLTTTDKRDSLAVTSPPGTNAALNRVVNNNTPSTSSSRSQAKKDKDTKSPPSSFSRGVNLFRKKQSKSPPPSNSMIHPAISA